LSFWIRGATDHRGSEASAISTISTFSPPPERLFRAFGDVVFRHTCTLGCEGIVNKCLGSRYRSGRLRDWLKFKKPAAPAVKRAEEEWGKERWR
jgi:hypothetical protein